MAKPVSLGWAIWSTKLNRVLRRHIYQSKGVAKQYCRDFYGDVPVEVFATSYEQVTTASVPLMEDKTIG